MCIKKIISRAFAFNSHVVAFLNSLFNPLNYVYIYYLFIYICIIFFIRKKDMRMCVFSELKIATSLLILKKQKKNRLNL